MRTGNRHWLRAAVALGIVILATGLGAVPGSMARSSGQPPELPPVSLSTIVFREGETVTMSGSGCVDPTSGLGDGLVVVLRRPIDPGRGGFGRVVTIQAEVRSDGTFSGAGTVSQPLYPVGSMDVTISCEPPPSDPHAWPQGEPIASRTMRVTVEASSLSDLTVTAGSTANVTLPCDVPPNSYGFFGLGWPDEAVAGGMVGLSVPGAYPPGHSPQTGDVVAVEVPENATPGRFAADADCGVSQGGRSAHFVLNVTVLAPGTPTRAQPVPGTAQYTG